MGTHTVTVGAIDNGITIQHPLRATIDIGTLGDVVNLHIAIGRHDTHIGIRITHVGNQGHREPFSVGRPFIAYATVMLRTIGNLAHFL